MYKQGEETAIIAFYDPQDHLSEAMFLPVPKFELWFHDHNLLTEPDLIKFLKMFDPAPSIEVGAAVFFQIGIATDADPPTADTKEVDRTINCFVKGTFGDPKTAP